MRHGHWAMLAAAAMIAAGAASAPGQSLGEVAAKERARRKGKTPAKVYTDADVRTVSTPSAPDAGEATAAAGETSKEAAAGAAQGAAKESEKSPDELRAEERKAWIAELDKLNAEVAGLDAEIARLEAAANDTRGYLYGNRRTVVLEQLEKARADRKTAQQRLDDLLESGRRRGFGAP